MNYTTKHNDEFNSTEIYFDGKPSENIRAALKEHKFRWHGVKKCWYGKLSAEEVAAIIDGNKPKDLAVTLSDGYLGAIEMTGCNYGMLFGSDLSKAIRKTLKDYNVSGVSVSCHSYSGGQSITVKVKASASDFISVDEYKANYTVHELMNSNCGGWYRDPKTDEEKPSRDFWNLSAAEQAEAVAYNAEIKYNYARNTEYDINQFHIGKYTMFTAAFIAKLELIKKVLDSFNHDDSNAMVDYFDRHFYETITVIAA